MRTRNEMMPPADAGPVERPVRPGDWSEMSESRKALLAAFGAASAAREQDLRGQYPKAAIVLAEEVFSLRAALRQKHAEYDDMKSLLLGNARNLNLEGEKARQALRAVLSSNVGQQTLAQLADGQGTATEEGQAWLEAAALVLGPNAGGEPETAARTNL